MSEITASTGLTAGSSWGRGFYRPLPIAQPAPGLPVSFASSDGEFLRVVALTCVFATSAVVANRQPRFVVNDQDGNLFYSIPLGAAVVAGANTTLQWQYGGGSGFSGADGTLVGSLPNIFIPAGFKLSISAVNLDPGDQFKNVRGWAEAYPWGPAGYPTSPGRIDEGP